MINTALSNKVGVNYFLFQYMNAKKHIKQINMMNRYDPRFYEAVCGIKVTVLLNITAG